MIESIYIGLSGLSSYSSGLRVIANNVANLNTPGFKSSSMQFANLFYTGGGTAGGHFGSVGPQYGYGVTSARTSLNFNPGELRQTGNALDLALNGAGLFVLRNDSGVLHYTRAGQFEFNKDGVLVDRTSGFHVMAVGSDGRLSKIDLTGHRVSPPKATGMIKFAGNLSSTETEVSVSTVTVIDSTGVEHALSLKFTNQSAVQAGRWTATLLDGATTVGTATLDFVSGLPKAGASQLSFKYTPAKLAEMTVVMDLGGEVTSFASGTLSTLSVASQDGATAGNLTRQSFDEKGVLQFEYSNSQKTAGPRLALASVEAPQLLAPVGTNDFELAGGARAQLGAPGDASLGTVQSGSVEISNVDLSQEFSDMVIMQRGYQASSQIVSTANDMLQELFSMKR